MILFQRAPWRIIPVVLTTAQEPKLHYQAQRRGSHCLSTGVTQVAAAVGAAAVTVAAVSSKMSAVPPPVPFADGFVPPICSDQQVIKEGLLEMHLEGFTPTSLPDFKRRLEVMFRGIYNDITGMVSKHHVAFANLVGFDCSHRLCFCFTVLRSLHSSTP